MNGCIMQTQHELPNVYLSTEQGELQFEIPPKARSRVRADLQVLSVKKATLFPDLDHLSEQLGELEGEFD